MEELKTGGGTEMDKIRGHYLPAVGGRRMDCTNAMFEQRCLVCLRNEQEKTSPDNGLIALICDAVRLVREYNDSMRRPVDPLKENNMDRAQLGIDGNCGFALLGVNIQEGEAEFVEIINTGYTVDDELRASKQAFRKLQQRLGRQDLSYWFGPSHPYGR